MDAIVTRPTVDLPFLPPADKVITLNLPVPLSVNKTRKMNWGAKGAINKWVIQADMRVMAGGGIRKLGNIPGQFEIKIVLDETKCRLDADNAIKLLVDYCRRLRLITDDSKKYMRRVIVEWGHAPTGCRVTIQGISDV